MSASRDIPGAVDGVWRMESARIVATLTKATGDLGLAEDAAQEALLEALEKWPATGVPRNAGAWLTTVAKRRAIDAWRRRATQDDRYRTLARELEDAAGPSDAADEPIDDDVLRLVFIACHPVLSRESQIALTLRVVSGLNTPEIARMLLVPVPTVQARITRAKKTLSAAAVPFATPDPSEWGARLAGVLGVVYLLFTEGYAATAGDRWIRPDLANEALRLARVLAALMPREPEAHGLVALLELQASRFAARVDADGSPVLLGDQDRTRWDRAQIVRGGEALARADALGRGRGPYALQAAIAQCHTVAPSLDETDWERIVVLYEALGRIAPSPVVELNRAVAVSMVSGPEAGLALVAKLADEGMFTGSHLLPSVRGELYARSGRTALARADFLAASELTANERQRTVLRAKADALAPTRDRP